MQKCTYKTMVKRAAYFVNKKPWVQKADPRGDLLSFRRKMSMTDEQQIDKASKIETAQCQIVRVPKRQKLAMFSRHKLDYWSSLSSVKRNLRDERINAQMDVSLCLAPIL